MIGGTQFYERKEIKDILAYLRLVVNPFDRTAFFRIINCPARGLGNAFEAMIQTYWQQEPFLNYIQMLQNLIERDAIKGVKKESVEQFLRCFNNTSVQSKPSEALALLVTQTQYISHLKNSCERDEAESRIGNVHELINAVQHMESEGTITNIEQLLDEISLMQEKSTYKGTEDSHVVTLMTLHAAKGLEFDWVILAGLEDGILPSTRSLLNNSALEEERRLFYVGITRARERVLITHSKYRYTYGQMIDQIPSRFLKEISENVMRAYDLSTKKSYSLFFQSWLGLCSSNESAETNPIMTFSSPFPEKPRFNISKKNIFNKRFSPKTPKKTPVISSPASPSTKKNIYKKNQTVRHAKYGVGIIQKIEKQSATVTYVTVQFKSGTKKIVDRFLTQI